MQVSGSLSCQGQRKRYNKTLLTPKDEIHVTAAQDRGRKQIKHKNKISNEVMSAIYIIYITILRPYTVHDLCIVYKAVQIYRCILKVQEKDYEDSSLLLVKFCTFVEKH